MLARRVSLRSIGFVALLLTAGCLAGTTPVDSDASPSSAADPQPIGACPDDLERVTAEGIGADLPADTDHFTLTANRTDLRRGDPIRISLRNADDDRHYTGVRDRYVLQRRGPDGWRSVIGWKPGRSGWNATAFSHDPGTGWNWTLTTSESGVSTSKYGLCGSLPAGEYRFVFLGVVAYSSTGEVTQPPIAVEFRLRDAAT